MYYLAHQNAAGSKITVTNTATGIYDLINTAATTNRPRAGFPVDTNAIDINVEDGDIRLLWDGNTPTATNGMLLTKGNIYYFRGLPLEDMKLIRVSGDVKCSVMLGKSDRSESTNSNTYASSATIGTGSAGLVKRTIVSSKKAVAAGPTATALSATSLPVYKVRITNKVGNAVMYVGSSAVDATNGELLYATFTTEWENVDLNNVYILGTAGQEVAFTYTY